MKLKLLLSLTVSILLFTQCRKDEQFTSDPGAKLEFSQDTIIYDTIFTTLGSITKRFTVRNKNDQAVRISNISLLGGAGSAYRINVDGVAGTDFTDVEILGNDSLYVFVEATLDVNNASNPLLIEDNISFLTNGNEQRVLLIAYGQDAYFHFPDTTSQGNVRRVFGIPFGIVAGVNENIQWQNDKPHVVFGYAVVDSVGFLEILPGTRVHFHNNSGMLVWRDGQLKAEGTQNDKIYFEGDRLEPLYDELPGQWDRIWILDNSTTNPTTFKHVEIKNSLVGIQAETAPWLVGVPTNATAIDLESVSIQNCSAAGLLTRNYNVNLHTALIANCGQSCIALQGGGSYQFSHVTLGNYWSYEIRQTPSFYFTNKYLNANGNIEARDINASTFGAGIIWGNVQEEFETDFDMTGNVNFQFTDYLIRTTLDLTGPEYSNVNTNSTSDPRYADPSVGDYRLTGNSSSTSGSAVDETNIFFFSGTDLDGNGLQGGQFDLGCYEYQP